MHTLSLGQCTDVYLKRANHLESLSSSSLSLCPLGGTERDCVLVKRQPPWLGNEANAKEKL